MSETPHISYFHQLLFDIPFFATSKQDALMYIQKSVEDGDFLTVATPNPEQIVQATEDKEFKKALLSFDLFLPDGQGVVWASKMLRKPLSQRIAGVDVVEELLQTMQKKKQTGLIVGGRGYNEKISNFKFQISNDQSNKIVPLSIRGFELFWYEDFDRDYPADNESVLTWIKKNKPTYVFVALGAPYQEEWILAHRDELEQAGVKCAMVVGGAFDVLIGRIQRAPEFIQQFGFEWGWRLLLQPWRWKRQLRLVEFVRLVFKQVGRQ